LENRSRSFALSHIDTLSQLEPTPFGKCQIHDMHVRTRPMRASGQSGLGLAPDRSVSVRPRWTPAR
jgi:hypothetical protein